MANEANKLAKLSALEALATRMKGKLDAIEIPAKVSDLTNDSKFQTEEQVAAAVAAADHLKRKVVASVDAIDVSAADASQYIYMVSKGTGADGDQYDEYMVMNGAAEKVGDWAVDLSGYVTKEDGKGLSESDYTSVEKTKLAGVAEGATKVEAAAGSGTLTINGSGVTLFEVATDAEVTAVLDAVFSVSEENA